MRTSLLYSLLKFFIVVTFVSISSASHAQGQIENRTDGGQHLIVACPEGFLNEVATLVNRLRDAQGLDALQVNPRLMRSAYLRAYDMATSEQLTHKGWQESIVEVGYSKTTIGENIADGYESPYSVVKGWYESREHRNNMFGKKYKFLGIGCVEGRGGKLWWSQHFGGEYLKAK